jgi:AcrR family transcriptional regulator
MPKKPFAQLSEADRKKLLRILLKLFAHHGYAGTSIKMITRQLRVADGYLYYYFKGKEDIARWVIDEGFGLWRENFDIKVDQQEDDDLYRLFKEAIVATAGFIRKHPDLYGTYNRFVNDPHFPLAKYLAERASWIDGVYLKALTREAEAGRLKKGVPPEMAAMLFDLVINRVWEFLYNPTIDPIGASKMDEEQLAGLADTLIAIFKNGLSA